MDQSNSSCDLLIAYPLLLRDSLQKVFRIFCGVFTTPMLNPAGREQAMNEVKLAAINARLQREVESALVWS